MPSRALTPKIAIIRNMAAPQLCPVTARNIVAVNRNICIITTQIRARFLFIIYPHTFVVPP